MAAPGLPVPVDGRLNQESEGASAFLAAAVRGNRRSDSDASGLAGARAGRLAARLPGGGRGVPAAGRGRWPRPAAAVLARGRAPEGGPGGAGRGALALGGRGRGRAGGDREERRVVRVRGDPAGL